MIDWQANLTKSLQKENPNGKVTSTSNAVANKNNAINEMEKHHHEEVPSSQPFPSKVLIVKGAATLGDKAFLPPMMKVEVGTTVTWTNNDDNLHTVTSGSPNTASAGEVFDSGLTALIMPAKTYSHKFTSIGEFPYFCRVHPTMVGKIIVVP